MFILVILLIITLTSVSIEDSEIVSFHIDYDSNAHEIAINNCLDQPISCYRLARPAIEAYQYKHFNKQSSDSITWKFNELCDCQLPNQLKLNFLQHLHIPKTGTSINWMLHDYFNCYVNETNPCSEFLTNEIELKRGLCGGRLLSCQGHRVSKQLPDLIKTGNTYLVTILRDPWNRIQSDYHYILSKPNSEHLGDEVNRTDLWLNVNSLFEYTQYPGMNNCMTKMFNGFQCYEKIEVYANHLTIAKQSLSLILWFGITERFADSICLFAYMYGGEPKKQHIMNSRSGNYKYLSINEALNDSEANSFIELNKFDIELYRFANEIFDSRFDMTSCPRH